MTESKIERIIREVSFAAQCAEMALQGVKTAAYDSETEGGTHDRRRQWKLIFSTGRISALCSRV